MNVTHIIFMGIQLEDQATASIALMMDTVKFLGPVSEVMMLILALLYYVVCKGSGQVVTSNSPVGYMFGEVFRWHFTRGIINPKANDPDRQKENF
jgi:hypothetical protein